MTEVKVDWLAGDDIPLWDKKCIRVIESFGLPGGKYETELTEDYMIFHFKDPKDALVAKLMLGG
jgi:hypothetical protein